MDTAPAAPTRRVDMWYEGTAPQRRLTVAFRIILAIPQIIVVVFLGLATFVVVIIGWFGALFMGRLPEWVHTFVTGYVRWYARVSAYLTLLTDRYPPFALEDEAYPARPILPAPGRLNRWVVLFRAIVGIPAYVFAQIVRNGLTFPLIIVAWFIVLIRGEMPTVLYLPYAAIVRYETRLYSWLWMLTSEYPWGMLGDRVAPAPTLPPPPFPAPPGTPSATPPADAVPSAWGVPSASTTVQHEPVEPAGPDAAGVGEAPEAETPGQPPGWPPPIPPPAAEPSQGFGAMPPPSPWERVVPAAEPAGEGTRWGTLILTGAAHGWMIFAIVWGSIVTVTQVSVQAAARHHNASTVQQFNTTSSDVAAVNAAILKAASDAGTCTTMSSVAPSQQVAATKLSRLADDLSSMDLPGNAGSSARAVESDASQLATIFERLAAAPDCTTYRSIARASNFATILNSYPSDVGQLLSVLHADATS